MSDTVEVENPTLGKLKLTGQTALLILCMFAAGAALFGVYLHFEHEAKATVREGALARALEKLAESQEKQAKATQETGCVVAYTRGGGVVNPRETLDFCKQITR